MSSVVADTHTILWYLVDDPRMSVGANDALDGATAAGSPIYVPTICVVEATYLIEKNRIDAMAVVQLELAVNLPGSAFRFAPLTAEIALRLSDIPRASVPDLPDRVIAATALAFGCPLVTRDGRIRASNVETIW